MPEGFATHDDELHILGGHTRIVSGRASTTPSTSNATSNSTQSPASTGSPDGPYHRSSPSSSNTHRGVTPETLDQTHPSLLADLRTTKEAEMVVPSQSAVPSSFNPPVPGNGYDQMAYPQLKVPLSHINTSYLPSTSRAAQPALESWGRNPHTTKPPSIGSTGYVPAPSDTHSAFGMLGGDPDWDMQWHSFMDQLGMFTNEPNAPYAVTQLKMER